MPFGPLFGLVSEAAAPGSGQLRRRWPFRHRGLLPHLLPSAAPAEDGSTGIPAYLEDGGTLEHAQQPFAEGFKPKADRRERRSSTTGPPIAAEPMKSTLPPPSETVDKRETDPSTGSG
jgi:hypothetical protein